MKTAIVYSHKAVKTTQAAKMIKKALKLDQIDDLNVENISPEKFSEYNLLILGAPTWFDGELSCYWDELIPAIEDIKFKNLKVAIFGNGDQIQYPDSFGDAVGLLAEVFESSGAKIIGQTSTTGFTFDSSKALKNNKFVGLVLDFENQHTKNQERIENWVKEINSQLV